MKTRPSLAARAARYVFPLLLIACGSAQAGLLRYDVVFNQAPVGRLVFDAQIGAASQNLWGALVDWSLGWDGVLLDPSNSTPDASSRFFVNALGSVFDDGLERIVCTAPPGFPACAGRLEVTDNPAFAGDDGSFIKLFNSSIVGGTLLVGPAGGGASVEFGTLVYAGPSAVPLPATTWLIAPVLLLMGFTRFRKVT